MLPVAQLLGLPSSLIVLDVSRSVAGILVRVASCATSACCPHCHTASPSRHSRYTRTAQDLAWSGLAVTLQICTHKWRCQDPTCPQRVFAERLDPLLPRSARMTTRLIHLLRTLTLATSGRSAARLTRSLQPTLSSPTLLRHLMALPDPVPVPARIIGVDEFSFRRGQRGQGHHFGTLIVDLERHRVLDLLPERDATTVAAWLRAHPSIQMVSRDRAGSFAQAITAALPQAQQVLDRFHLLQNLRDVLERFFLTKREVLRQTRSAPVAADQEAHFVPPEPSAQEARVARWQHIHQQIHALAAKQVDVTTIARHVQVSRPTVYRYLQMPHPPQV
nr:ISL3 family transposase [Ktedonobacterales bacterium]